MTTAPVRPRVGLIVPPEHGETPPECEALFGEQIEYRTIGAALPQLDLEGYGEAERRLPAIASEFRDWGADAVVLMGTSLSFYRGRDHARYLEQMLADTAGVPATSMSSAIVAALKSLDAQRVAVATAYIAEVNRALVSFLSECDFEVSALSALELSAIDRIHATTSEAILDIGRSSFAKDPSCDAVFISCGGLRTLDVATRLEEETGKTVISSAVAGAWASAAIVGRDTKTTGGGRWLESGAKLDGSFIARPASAVRS